MQNFKMKGLFITLIFICFLIFGTSEVNAANRLIYWDFNNATYIDGNGGDTGVGWYPGGGVLTTDSPSPGSGGKNLIQHISSADSNTGIALRNKNSEGSWGTSEFYVRFWMYIHADISNDELESIKSFSVTNDTASNNFQAGNWFILNLYPTQFHLYSNGGASAIWFGSWNGFLQGGWHKYEVYGKYNTPGQSNGIIRAWIDDSLKAELTNVNYWNSTTVVNTFYLLPHFKTLYSVI